MNPLRSYITKLLKEHLQSQPVVVWYDPRREFEAYVDEATLGFPLVRLRQSHLALKLEVEPFLAPDRPGPVVIYLPGIADKEGVELIAEAVAMGKEWTPKLSQFARTLLQKRHTAGQIDQILADEPTYDKFCKLLEGNGGETSALQTVFPQIGVAEDLISQWLADPGQDEACEKPAAREELRKLLLSRLGGLVLDDGPVARWRATTLAFVLGNEFREDLLDSSRVILRDVPEAANQDSLRHLQKIADTLRGRHQSVYEEIATRVQGQLALDAQSLNPEILGSIDTFPFEETALFACGVRRIADRKFDECLDIACKRHDSFWVRRDSHKHLRWQLLELMARLGIEIDRVRNDLRKPPTEVSDWIRSYANSDGWHQMDGLFRQTRVLRSQIDDLESMELEIQLLDAWYEETVDKLAQAFLVALEKAQWEFPSHFSQARFWENHVAGAGRVAVIFVDALRLEMGWSLLQELSGAGTWELQPRVAMAPTITPVGMAALLPSAGFDFQVSDHGDAFAGQWGQNHLPGLKERQSWINSRAPGSVDILLADVLEESVRSLETRLKDASVVVVRSQEIDAFGEGGRGAASQAMDLVMPNLRRAVVKLANAGFETFRIVSDHGFLLGRTKDDSMRIDPPQGRKSDLHRRCWIGRGASTPPNCVRLRGADLGYSTDLEFVFPRGTGVFKAGGDLAYHHGGLSLQELVIPVLSGQCKPAKAKKSKSQTHVLFVPPAKITNRMVVISLQQEGSMLDLPLRPVFLAGSREVSRVAMVQPGTADFDNSTGIVTLKADQVAVICLQLLDDQVASVRLQAVDSLETNLLPTSPDIPVDLGI